MLPWETLKTSEMLKLSWLARGFDFVLSLSVRTQLKMIWWLDWVYFDWLWMRFGWRHFLIQPLRQSEKWIRALVLFVSLLSLGFRFSIFIKCWDPYVNPGCKVQLGVCGGLYFLLQHVDLVPSSYRPWLQFYNSISVSPGFCKGSMVKCVGSLISFLDSLLYPGWLFG